MIVLLPAKVNGFISDRHPKPNDGRLSKPAAAPSVRGTGPDRRESLSTTACYALAEGLAIEGYEVLKGREGFRTHEHSERVPILGCSRCDGSALL